MNGRSFSILLITLVTLGCGNQNDMGPTGRVNGVLTNKGKSLSPETQVVFLHSQSGTAAYGGTDVTGSFAIDSFNDGNIPIGVYRVMIQPPESQLEADNEPSAEDMLDNSAGTKPQKKGTEFAFKYRQLSTSGLEYEVKEGDNVFAIDLK